MTPIVKNKDNYNFGVGAQKYTPTITANTVPLDPNTVVGSANFCVGQYITFGVSGLPSFNSSAASFHWHLPGNYFNAETNPCPTCSTDPFVNSDLLANENTTVWWVSGGTPAEYTASVGMNLLFPNGQNASIAALGKFNMFRPQAKFTTQTTSVNVDTNENVLEFAIPYPVEQGITFLYTITITCSCSIKWVQVIESSERNLQDANFTWHQWTFDGPAPHLDAVPYTACNLAGDPVDSPAMSLPSDCLQANASDSFKMWLMFQPNGGIPVPLKVVEWSWSGSAINGPNGWELQTGVPGNPSVSETEHYPQWNSYKSQAQYEPPF